MMCMSTDNVIVGSQVWKHGTKGNGIEFANLKLLERHEPNTYKLMEWREGYHCQDDKYEYKVGMSKYGLWLSRKPLGQQTQIQIQTEDKPPQRPPMIQQEQPTVSVNTNYEIAELKKRVSLLEDLINKLTQSWVMNHQ
jgi:hypothetical protein